MDSCHKNLRGLYVSINLKEKNTLLFLTMYNLVVINIYYKARLYVVPKH